MILISWTLQRGFDSAIEIDARIRAEANETLHELALPIENECLWNRVLAAEEKAHEIFIRSSERILNSELLCERRHKLFVFWSTDVESDNLHTLIVILLL